MFDRICAELNLGALTAPPIRLHGGYTHRMFRLDTTDGRYAVKLLNPEIMQRPGVLDNYRAAEGFEALLERENLPILPALTIGGRKLHCVDGQYLYVFDHYDGRVLSAEEITPAHCAKIGGVLAEIHRAGENALPHPQTEVPGEGALWGEEADALLASDDACAEGALLQASVPMLERASAAAEDAVCRPCRPSATTTWTRKMCSGGARISASSTWNAWALPIHGRSCSTWRSPRAAGRRAASRPLCPPIVRQAAHA